MKVDWRVKMTELEFMINFHKDNKRQGPGSTEDTLKALNFMNLDQEKTYKVADIGCGTGAQTLTLAENINGEITAIDLFPQVLEKLNFNAKAHGLEDKINTRNESMEDLSFEKESFDIIWSEGAIYIMGFEAGIKAWKQFLKPEGYIAISEITWLTKDRPKAIEDYWNNEYTEMATASNKIKILEENGFMPIGFFVLPESSWTDYYYIPMEKRFDEFLKKHNHSEIVKKMIDQTKEEIKMYNKYKDFLSYGFYIAKKSSSNKNI